MDAGKDQKSKIDILDAMHYTASPWRQLTSRPSNIVFEKLATGAGNHQMLVTSQ
jgi:hypothetical protein